MSIIGTRPPLISETNFYELHHRARLAIKPGITGMSALVNELILENKGTFENKRINNIYEYGVYGKTIYTVWIMQ